MKRIKRKTIHFSKLMSKLVLSVPFITLTLIGNLIVFSFAGIIFFMEKEVNPQINQFIDALWWSFATTTTVGYGDTIPITFWGKVIGILLMLIGVAIFGIYTALFARAIIDDDVYMN